MTKSAQTIRCKPLLNEMLRTLRMDVAYERGAGDLIWYRDERGEEVEVLDLAGGYGTLLLGHAHPELVGVAQRFLTSGRPMHVQGSVRRMALELADELSARVGGEFCVVFGNSGAEAVEAALKHAMLETGGRTFIAVDRAFHGKTLGAVQCTANPEFRDPFVLAGLRVERVGLNDVESLEAAFASVSDPAGFLFEPIQGEGGVRLMEPEFARRAAELCASRGVPLIADECHTGLGRTGHFLGAGALGVRPDYVILSKALGGGLAKISACLIDRNRYRPEFDFKQSSTFAEDDYSCELALTTLRLIDSELIESCQRKGEWLMGQLRTVASEYPDVISEVRGRGLMIGIEFRRQCDHESFAVRYASAQDDFVYLLAGYFLNAHRIRVAPTLSDRWTLRLEPSALVATEQLSRFVAALGDTCERVRNGDVVALTSACAGGRRGNDWAPPQMHSKDPKWCAYDAKKFHVREQRSPSVRVAWLCHLIDDDDLTALEPRFSELPQQERDAHLARWAPRAGPVVLSAVDVQSRSAGPARLLSIMLPLTSSWAKRCIEGGAHRIVQAMVQRGVDIAAELGCSVVALGQFTSIATVNGTRVNPRGLGVTTGNSYAVALALAALKRAELERRIECRDAVLVVVGAAGNIGSICARILARKYQRTVLIGSERPGSLSRLRRLAKQIPNSEITSDLGAVKEARVVVAAASAVDRPLHAEHFHHDAVICDLAVPSTVMLDVASVRPDLLLIRGGIAQLPFGEDLEIPGFPLVRGQTFGCMAEGLVLGWEGVSDTKFTGNLTVEHIESMERMAERHGVTLGGYKAELHL